MYLLIGADIVPTKSNMDSFLSGDSDALLGPELSELMRGADFRLFNLEVPLADRETPIVKHGPNHIAPTDSVRGLKAMGIDLLTLANNHILDQGTPGLRSTVSTLDEAGIAHFGTGDLTHAADPYIYDLGGRRIGIYACTEHEFSLATEDHPGANPYDPLWTFDHISALRSRTDYVIVLYHGGKEIFRYPTPALRKTCRRLVDKGADLVLCQHSHCIGCEEKYDNGTIVYGQGNFLFDDDDSEFGKTGLLVSLDDKLQVSFIPVVKHESVVRLAADDEASAILAGFEARSNEAQSDDFIRSRYDEISEIYLQYYLQVAGGRESSLFQFLNRLSRDRLRRYRIKRKYGTDEMIALRNIIECEVHNELFIHGLKTKTVEQ